MFNNGFPEEEWVESDYTVKDYDTSINATGLLLSGFQFQAFKSIDARKRKLYTCRLICNENNKTKKCLSL